MNTYVKLGTIIVRNMEESIRFYTEVIGLRMDSQYKPAPGLTITLMCGDGDAMIELIESTGYDPGFYSVGLYVDDMKIAMERYKSKGAKILGEPKPTMVGSCGFIEDPNGVRLAIVKHDE